MLLYNFELMIICHIFDLDEIFTLSGVIFFFLHEIMVVQSLGNLEDLRTG